MAARARAASLTCLAVMQRVEQRAAARRRGKPSTGRACAAAPSGPPSSTCLQPGLGGRAVGVCQLHHLSLGGWLGCRRGRRARRGRSRRRRRRPGGQPQRGLHLIRHGPPALLGNPVVVVLAAIGRGVLLPSAGSRHRRRRRRRGALLHAGRAGHLSACPTQRPAASCSQQHPRRLYRRRAATAWTYNTGQLCASVAEATKADQPPAPLPCTHRRRLQLIRLLPAALLGARVVVILAAVGRGVLCPIWLGHWWGAAWAAAREAAGRPRRRGKAAAAVGPCRCCRRRAPTASSQPRRHCRGRRRCSRCGRAGRATLWQWSGLNTGLGHAKVDHRDQGSPGLWPMPRDTAARRASRL